MRGEILIGGKAGQGPNVLSEVVAQGLISAGFFVFYSRDYQSLIRGGHNFNLVSFSDKPIYSNSSKTDLLVCLDENTEKLHKGSLVLKFVSDKGNMYYAGVLFKILGLEFKLLEAELKKLKKFEENVKDAKDGYENEKRNFKLVHTRVSALMSRNKDKSLVLKNGSEATAVSALKSGLDIYYAYPMTPATPLMMELGEATLSSDSKHRVVEVENEIAVALAGIGSAVVGKRAMVGTSGGGFDLMTESLSFAAMAEVPMVFYLSQRPGPGTGVATYTSQGDLNMALHSGHGEFFRMVLAPGDNEESVKLTNDAFYFAHKYRIPAIILNDKHLAESKSLFDEKKILSGIKEIKSNVKVGERFNSYESDKKLNSIATEDADVIKANFEKRIKKQKEIEKESGKFEQVKIYGNKNSTRKGVPSVGDSMNLKNISGNLILSWGSTKGAILDAIKNLDVKFVHILYMNPFPAKEILAEIKKSKKVLVVENNSESPLSRLIAEKTGFIVEDKNKILRYDGRPFFSDELAEEINKRIGDKNAK
jgi:2-oxoglutarate ferredoxin oxidoreductase subunit alpha